MTTYTYNTTWTYLMEFLKWSSAGFLTVQLLSNQRSASEESSEKRERDGEKSQIAQMQRKHPCNHDLSKLTTTTKYCITVRATNWRHSTVPPKLSWVYIQQINTLMGDAWAGHRYEANKPCEARDTHTHTMCPITAIALEPVKHSGDCLWGAATKINAK